MPLQDAIERLFDELQGSTDRSQCIRKAFDYAHQNNLTPWANFLSRHSLYLLKGGHQELVQRIVSLPDSSPLRVALEQSFLTRALVEHVLYSIPCNPTSTILPIPIAPHGALSPLLSGQYLTFIDEQGVHIFETDCVLPLFSIARKAHLLCYAGPWLVVACPEGAFFCWSVRQGVIDLPPLALPVVSMCAWQENEFPSVVCVVDTGHVWFFHENAWRQLDLSGHAARQIVAGPQGKRWIILKDGRVVCWHSMNAWSFPVTPVSIDDSAVLLAVDPVLGLIFRSITWEHVAGSPFDDERAVHRIFAIDGDSGAERSLPWLAGSKKDLRAQNWLCLDTPNQQGIYRSGFDLAWVDLTQPNNEQVWQCASYPDSVMISGKVMVLQGRRGELQLVFVDDICANTATQAQLLSVKTIPAERRVYQDRANMSPDELIFSNDSSLLFAGERRSQSHNAVGYHSHTGRLVLDIVNGPARFSPDGRTVYCETKKSFLRRWDLRTGELGGEVHLGEARFGSGSSIVKDESSCELVISSGENSAAVWDLSSSSLKNPISFGSFHARHIVFKQDRVVLLSSHGGLAFSVLPVELPLTVVDSKKGYSSLFTFSGGVGANYSKGVDLYSWEGEFLGCLEHSHYISCFALGADNTLVTGDENGVLRLWDLTSSSLIAQIRAHDSAIVGVCFDESGAVYSSAKDNVLRKIDSALSHIVNSLPMAAAVPSMMYFSGRLLCGCSDGVIRCVRIGSFEELWTVQIGYVNADILSVFEGQFVVSYLDTMVVFDAETGAQQHVFYGASRYSHIEANELYCVVHPECWQGYDPVTGEPVSIRPIPPWYPHGLCFSADYSKAVRRVSYLTFPWQGIELVDVASSQVERKLQTERQPNGAAIVNERVYVLEAGRIWLCSWATQTLEPFCPHLEDICLLRGSTSGQIFVFSESNGLIAIDESSGERVWQYKRDGLRCLVVSSALGQIVLGYNDGLIEVRNERSKDILTTWFVGKPIVHLAQANDQTIAYSTDDPAPTLLRWYRRENTRENNPK